ncbi:MAG TPA: DNA-binding protein [Methanothermococcus okinawensis]|uniref:DNA-binding protein EYH15_00655 n=1 Tax=Methanothermococcus okinawensis TaxID=155863 RepID=A0A832ZAU1_9EURY|nr:DNA-binding protein [Methanothermococcus okinawensis]HIP91207.1 DNA-binding protein [Methanothermococcus okinawensis]
MDIEEIKRKKLMELQKRMATNTISEEEQQALQLQQEYELQKRKILRQILTEPARARLARLRLAKPELAAQVELQLIQLAQMGRIQVPVSDEELKSLLEKLHEMSKSKRGEIKFIRK